MLPLIPTAQDVTTISGQVNTLQDEVDALSTQVDDLVTNTTGLSDTLDALDAADIALQDNIDELATDVTTVETNLTTLQGNVTTLEGDLTDLTATVSSHTSDLSTIDGQITALDSSYSTLATDLNTAEGRLDDLDDITDDHTTSINNLSSEVDTNTSAIEDLEDEIVLLRSYLDPRKSGVTFDGVTDDTTAWETVFAAASSANTIILHPGGTSLISNGLEFADDSYASIFGNPGSSVFKAKAGSTFTRPMISQDMVTGYGARHGHWKDFIVDGNSVASIGIQIQCVDRQFDNIQIQNCTRIGLYNTGSQNCVFNSIKCFGNGTNTTSPFPDANYCMDLGARLNTHVGMQLSAWSGDLANRGVCNLLITQSAVSSIAGGEPPSFNSFYCCQFERKASVSWQGSVIHEAGIFNSFDKGTIQATDYPCVIINSDKGYASGYLQFNGTAFSTNNRAIRAYSSTTGRTPAACLWGGILIETTTTYFSVADNNEIQVNGTIFGGGTTLAENYGGGTDTIAGLVTSRMLSLPTTPNSTTGIPAGHAFSAPVAYDAATQAVAVYQGSWRDANLS